MSVMVSCRLLTGRQKPLHLPTKCSCTYLQKCFALFCKTCLQKTVSICCFNDLILNHPNFSASEYHLLCFKTHFSVVILSEPLREPDNHNSAQKCAFYRELLTQLPIRYIIARLFISSYITPVRQQIR